MVRRRGNGDVFDEAIFANATTCSAVVRLDADEDVRRARESIDATCCSDRGGNGATALERRADSEPCST
jgi:hypothetical protein